MDLLRGVAVGVVISAGLASAQPTVPGPGQMPPANWFGPMVIPLIVGTVGLIALTVYVVWRMVGRMRRRQNEGPPRSGL